MAITKLFLFIIGLIAQLHTITPPSVRPSPEQLCEQLEGRHLASQGLMVMKTILYSWALLEASVLVALSGYCPPALARTLLYLVPASLTPSDLTALTTPTPPFLVGIALILAGTLLRAHCFHTLGQHFTFELSLRPSHELITHGTYSVVRHPSYTGGLSFIAGLLLCVLDPRGVVVTVFAGVFGTRLGNEHDPMLTAVLACVWTAVFGCVSVGVWRRMNREDTMLEKQFGDAWQGWAKRVPYRLVPGIY